MGMMDITGYILGTGLMVGFLFAAWAIITVIVYVIWEL